MKIFWAGLCDPEQVGQVESAHRAKAKMLTLPCSRYIDISTSGQHFLQATLSPGALLGYKKQYQVKERSVFVGGGRLYGRGFTEGYENNIESGEVLSDGYFRDLTKDPGTLFQGDREIPGEIGGLFWDGKNKLARVQRDYFGAIPIYYFLDSGLICVSNHLGVLLASLRFRPKLCEVRLIDWIQGFSERNELTAHEGVLRLPAGHRMEWRPNGELKLERYYDLRCNVKDVQGNFEENSDRLRSLLAQAVARRLEPKGPIGVELSGGLDSSGIAALSSQLAGPRVTAFCSIYPGNPVSDESEYINSVVEQYSLRSFCFDGANLDVIASFKDSLKEFSDFHYAANIHVVRHIQQLAIENDCVQILNGIDGDNVASHGLYLLKQLSEEGHWIRFGRAMGSISGLFSSYWDDPDRALFGTFGKKEYDRQSRKRFPFQAVYAAVALSLTTTFSLRWLLGNLRRTRRELANDRDLNQSWKGLFRRSDFKQAFLDRTGYEDAIANSAFRDAPKSELEAQLRSLSSGVNEHVFELTHSISAARGISTTSPFMDKDLIEFCVGVPAEHKLRNGWNRAFLRHGLRKDYPANVGTRRTKSNLAPSVYPTFRKVCIPEIQRLLENPDCPVWKIFEQTTAQRLLEAATARSNRSDSALFKLWMLWVTSEILDRQL